MQITDIATRNSHYLIVLGLIGVLTDCSSKKQDEKLVQAYELHLEAMTVHDGAEKDLNMLKESADSSYLELHGAALDSADNWLDNWSEQVVEVPGFEEEHNHEGHHHHHHQEQQLTSEQQLQVQQHLLTEIQRIAKSIDQLQKQ